MSRIYQWLDAARARPDACRNVLLAIGLTMILVHWVQSALKPSNDLANHLSMAGAMVRGEYFYFVNTCYPPLWPLVHIPLSHLPVHVAAPLLFPLAILALVVLLTLLHRLTREYLPLRQGELAWVTAAALFLASRYWFRDMRECGVNLALVAMTWLALALWQQRREWLGGACLGFAMALKSSPGLFLIWFLWKRQWKMAATTTCMAGLFSLTPLLAMKADLGERTYRDWLGMVLGSAGQKDPSIGALGPDDLLNFSLRPALARFLMVLPADHPCRYDHPLYRDFLDLPPIVAGQVIKGLSLLLLAAVLWQFRRPVVNRHDPILLWEWAAFGVMILLFSPIAETQHAVGLIPAFYLLMRKRLAEGPLPRWISAMLVGHVVLILFLNRSLIGMDLTYVVKCHYVQTWLLLALLFAMLACGRRAAIQQQRSSQPISQLNDVQASQAA